MINMLTLALSAWLILMVALGISGLVIVVRQQDNEEAGYVMLIAAFIITIFTIMFIAGGK